MTLNQQILVAMALSLAAAGAQADTAPAPAAAPPPPPVGWHGKGEAGAVVASGNTKGDTVNFKLGLTEIEDQWTHALDMAFLQAKNGTSTTNSVETANRFTAGWQSNYAINARSFWFGGLRYDHDKFSGFDYQATASTGLGYKFIDTDAIKFSGQVGAGYRRSKIEVPLATTPVTFASTTDGNAVFVAGFDYANVLTAATKIVDKFHAEVGSGDTLLTNFLGLEVKMSTALALSVGLDVRDNTKPPALKKQLDTVTTVNLVYAF